MTDDEILEIMDRQRKLYNEIHPRYTDCENLKMMGKMLLNMSYLLQEAANDKPQK